MQLQTRLAELRDDVGPVDSTFGSSTKHAVIAFQKINGLTRDGIVGPKTHAALNKPVVRKVRTVRTETYLEVDLTRQVVLLAKDGKVTRTIDASTGKTATPNPGRNLPDRTSERRLPHRCPGNDVRPAYFHRGYAFNGYPSVPAHPASHGSVRMTNPAMNRLRPHLKIATPVQTYR